MNELIYPFYIFHQTVIVIFAYYIVQWEIGLWLKLITLLSLSLVVTVVICRFFIAPFNSMRFLFGVREKK